jgi:hypothetical protein
LNPTIYTLRNKDIMVALRKLITTLSTWAKPFKFRNIILFKENFALMFFKNKN